MEKTGSQIAPDDVLIARHPAMLSAVEAARRAGRRSAPVLITGESGTGKELVAREVHRHSACASGPFVVINCAGIPPHLIASELFGHERGAFTDAKERRIGKVEAANKGTLFLDEIGDLPLDLQGYLLRFLEESTIERVGGSKPIAVDVAIVAATNRDLKERIACRAFRQDLFFRLAVVQIPLPPLRDRGDDALHIAERVLAEIGREIGRPDLSLGESARRAILSYPWPGNVRELRAALRRAAILAETPKIGSADLALPLTEERGSLLLDEVRERAEREAIRAALERTGGNMQRAARELGIARGTLYRIIERHDMMVPVRQRPTTPSSKLQKLN